MISIQQQSEQKIDPSDLTFHSDAETEGALHNIVMMASIHPLCNAIVWYSIRYTVSTSYNVNIHLQFLTRSKDNYTMRINYSMIFV